MYWEREEPENLQGKNDRYKVLVKELGRGSMGTTYEAIPDKNKGTLVAAKVYALHDTFMRDLALNEAHIHETLENNGIVQLLDRNPSDNEEQLFLILEKAMYGTLARYVKNPLPPSIVVTLIQQVADSLAYVHEQGITHRDVNPTNVFLTDKCGETVVLLGDFSLAVQASLSHPYVNLLAAGTEDYMAPEQFTGIATPLVDEYALGCMTYELLMGKPPFSVDGSGKTSNEIFQAYNHLHRTVKPLFLPTDEINFAMLQTIQRALMKNPQNRFSTVAEYSQELIKAYSNGSQNMRRHIRLYDLGDR